MKFNEWSRKRLEMGVKRLTSRTKPHYDDEDVIYVTPPLPLWFIKRFLYRDEGAESPEELQKVINQIFRHKVDENREFYVHVLKQKEVMQG